MSMRVRILSIFAVLVLTLSATGIVVAQMDGPDPNSPIKVSTPTETSGDDSVATETQDSEAGTPVGDMVDPGDSAGTPISPDATPVGPPSDFDLAAMTLDGNAIPDEWFLFAERYQ